MGAEEANKADFEKLFEDERVCTPWSLACGLEATWLAVATCCGLEMPLCDDHKIGHAYETTLLALLTPEVACKICHKEIDLAVDDAVHYVRINK